MKIIRAVATCIVLGSTMISMFAAESMMENIKLQGSLEKRFKKLLLGDEHDVVELTTKIECEKFLNDTGATRFVDSIIYDSVNSLYELCKAEEDGIAIDNFITNVLIKKFSSTYVEDIVALTLYCAEYWSARNRHGNACKNLLMAKEARSIIYRTFLLNGSSGYYSLLLIINQVRTDNNLNSLIHLFEITFLDELVTSRRRNEFREMLEIFSQNLPKLLVLAWKYKNKSAMQVLSAIVKKFGIPMPSKTLLRENWLALIMMNGFDRTILM